MIGLPQNCFKSETIWYACPAMCVNTSLGCRTIYGFYVFPLRFRILTLLPMAFGGWNHSFRCICLGACSLVTRLAQRFVRQVKRQRSICISPGGISVLPAVRWMHSRSEEKENRRRAHEPASSGGGRYRSLCGAVFSGAQSQVDHLATPESVVGHYTLPHRRAGRAP